MRKCRRCGQEDGECIAGYEHVFDDEKERFNKYCVEVMGWVSCSVGASLGKDLDNQERFNGEAWCIPPSDTKGGGIKHFKDDYNPYDDLNQMAEVVENRIHWILNHPYQTEFTNDMMPLLINCFRAIRRDVDIKQAFRDFIISTMPT